MTDNPSNRSLSTRILRDKVRSDHTIETSSRLSEEHTGAGRGTACFVGQVYNGGSMPQGQGITYLLHPLLLSGGETEGGTDTPQVDTSRSIPVVVLGSRQVAVGDMLIAHSVGGRWVADGGVNLPNCNPQCVTCQQNRYTVSGTVNDGINGTQPLVYDFVKQAWYSKWLPFTSSSSLLTGIGQSPCSIGNGTGYYYYWLNNPNSSTNPLVANLFLPGQSCRLNSGQLVTAFFSFPGSSYPNLLGAPANTSLGGFTLQSGGSPSNCDPLTYAATFSGFNTPITSATFSIPKLILPLYGYTCMPPCPIPRKNLTVSWVNTSGNGSGTLTYNAATQDWTMACQGSLSVRLYETGSNTLGFTVTLWGSAGCSGTSSSAAYPTSMGLSSFTCSPLYFAFNFSSISSALYTSGYRSFVVTE